MYKERCFIRRSFRMLKTSCSSFELGEMAFVYFPVLKEELVDALLSLPHPMFSTELHLVLKERALSYIVIK
jgi:hypothetical protein